MKTTFFIFLLGVIAGVLGDRYWRAEGSRSSARTNEDSFTGKAGAVASDVTSQTRETAGRMRDSIGDKLQDWHLTPEEIKADLSRTGEVVRSKARAAGEMISDARIVSVIKAKYVLDRDLSALDITVSVDNGEVRLGGVVASPGLIGRAIQLALDTDGVSRVTSRVTVEPKAG